MLVLVRRDGLREPTRGDLGRQHDLHLRQQRQRDHDRLPRLHLGWRNRLSTAERSGGGITTYGYDHTGQRVFEATGSATTSYPNRYYNVASSSLIATTTIHIFS